MKAIFRCAVAILAAWPATGVGCGGGDDTAAIPTEADYLGLYTGTLTYGDSTCPIADWQTGQSADEMLTVIFTDNTRSADFDGSATRPFETTYGITSYAARVEEGTLRAEAMGTRTVRAEGCDLLFAVALEARLQGARLAGTVTQSTATAAGDACATMGWPGCTATLQLAMDKLP